jgi:dephospho-CoA kinase
MAMPKAYGLTGGICSGKSTVADLFKGYGVPVLNADDISREVCQKGQSAWVEIKKIFGEGVLNNDESLNRKKLSEIVFSDPKKRQILEGIQHPLIMKRIKEEIKKLFDAGQSLVLVEAALILEAGYEKDFHGLIVVDCKSEQQIKRLCEREKISQKKALKIIEAQMPLIEKVKKATFVIDNSMTLKETKKNTEAVFNKVKAKKERKQPQWH